MAYYLERLTEGSAEHRSPTGGATLREATNRADATIKDESLTVAVIRQALDGDMSYGHGRIVASYTDAGGWARDE